MSTKREDFLGRIRAKLPHTRLPAAQTEHPGPFPGYDHQPKAQKDDLVANFKRELEALAGHVYILSDIEQIVSAITGILHQHQAKHIIAWDDASLGLTNLGPALAKEGVTIVRPDLAIEATARKDQLARIDDIRIGLTGADGGLADTGAVALISGPGRSRLASLLPPIHLAVLPATRLYADLPAFLAANPKATSAGSNMVLIAGPSRTGDIELTLSMGVHGPAEVHVIMVP